MGKANCGQGKIKEGEEMFDKTREFLVKIGLPAGDAFDLPTSEKRFPDGHISALRFRRSTQR